MTHRNKTVKPDKLFTKDECQKMIDEAIDKHNKTATIISASIGCFLLFFYAQGLLIITGLWTKPF